MTNHYTLTCASSEKCFADDPDAHGSFLLHSPHDNSSLLRTCYRNPLRIGDTHTEGLFAFSWLPNNYQFSCTSYPVTYKSTKLSEYLGLSHLYLTYSGYNPDIGAYNYTGTFKEFEAIGVFTRQGYRSRKQLVLASAGNTARAFCEIGSQLNARVIIVLPQRALKTLWTKTPQHPHICIIAVDGTYNDAIEIAKRISKYDECMSEGGVYNIGRRDGLATTFLSAVACMNRIPDHYIQAIGSGSGAISAWESSLRLQQLGMCRECEHEVQYPTPSSKTRSGHPTMHIAQNAPFAPVVQSWNAHSKTFRAIEPKDEMTYLHDIHACVLANNKPPYSIGGGLYDMLCDCNGYGYACTNEEARTAGALFQQLEGFTISASSEIALAALCNACTYKRIDRDDYVMLNITGGDYNSTKTFATYEVTAHAILTATVDDATLLAKMRSLRIV